MKEENTVPASTGKGTGGVEDASRSYHRATNRYMHRVSQFCNVGATLVAHAALEQGLDEAELPQGGAAADALDLVQVSQLCSG
jgi:hypothetical protein